MGQITFAAFAKPLEEVVEPWLLSQYVKHLSATSLNMGARCPRQFQERYIHGKKVPPDGAITLGSAEWGAHTINYEQKIRSGLDLPEGDLEDAYAASWDRTIDDSGGVGEIDWKEQKPEELQGKGLRMAQLYHREVSPRVFPAHVEKKVEFEVPGIPVPLVAYLDAITRDPEAGTLAYNLEHKTTARRVTAPRPNWRIQGGLYVAATTLPLQWHAVISTKEPQLCTPLDYPELQLAPTVAQRLNAYSQARAIASMLNHFLVALGPDEPWPATGINSEACGWCGYKSNCPAWRR
jgi:hypothetical protein